MEQVMESCKFNTNSLRRFDGQKRPPSPGNPPLGDHPVSNLYTLMTNPFPSHHSPLISQPRRQTLLDLRAMTAEEPLHIPHARAVLLPIPGRPQPPVLLTGRLQAEQGQPHQAHRHPLRRAGPLDRVPRPGPALLPPQPPAVASGPGRRPPVGTAPRTTPPSATQSTPPPR